MLLNDHRIEEKQSFKHLSVYICIKYRKLQCIEKNYLVPLIFFVQIAFLVNSSIYFICTQYFYSSTKYRFSFIRDIFWLSSKFSFQWQYRFFGHFWSKYFGQSFPLLLTTLLLCCSCIYYLAHEYISGFLQNLRT